jgi:hypothetical protein
MSPCLAYPDDGTLCRAPASLLDHRRGGLVCLRRVPDDVAAEISLYLKLGRWVKIFIRLPRSRHPRFMGGDYPPYSPSCPKSVSMNR